MAKDTYRTKFSKISDKIPELTRETTYDVYYGEASKDDIKQYVENPVEYLESKGIPNLKGFQLRTTFINQELLASGREVTSCASVTVFHNTKQVEVVLTAHEEEHAD
jgi:hypothetical protein